MGLFASGPSVFASGQQPAPAKPVPTAQPPQRPAGVLPTSTLRLGSDEAVRLALENNLGIQVERLNPQLQTLAVSRALAAYTPEIYGATAKNSDSSPPTDFLSQGVAVTSTERITGNAGIRQNVPWLGGRYNVGISGLRFTSNAPRTPFSPQLGSDLDLGYTQPLLRGMKIDAFRQSVLQSQKQLEIADVQLAQRITITSRQVRNAYFNLILARSSYDVARSSLELARTSLRNNERRVEVGTMAPIDIVEAQAEVARQEEAVIVRQGVIEGAEDVLRTLIMNPSQPDFWTTRIEPAEQPTLTEQPVDVEGAIRNALTNRTDLVELRKQLESVDLDIKYNQNQKMPAIDLTAAYGLTGVGGTQYRYGPDPGDGTPPTIVGQSQRSFSDVLRDVFGNDFRSWSVAVNVSYPIGTSQADAALASSRLQRQQGQVQMRQLEMTITAQVREAARDISTTLQRVQATRKTRDLMERRLEAENKRLEVGLSDTFKLFQAQRDLDNAKQSELQAVIDYNRALIDLESVQTVPLGGGGGF
ncbi:MAG TPA: TolC family protein [Vicinamibacterales bacterium]|nr:TolC family protein [Vicinamibacterales bacterium]